MDKYDTIVIGGGASGMVCAGTLAKNEKKTALIEKNDRLGKKLSITGKGRCNITNMTDRDGLMKNVASNPSFLFSAFSAFSPEDLIALLEDYGLLTKTERGNRVFPLSDKASDVVDCLSRYMKDNDADILLNSSVRNINVKNGEIIGVTLSDERRLFADSIVIACGGMSYPKTGSDGNGYTLSKRLGHSIIPTKPSLCPLLSADGFIGELQGLSLRNVSIVCYVEEKAVYEDFGEMIFTHEGVSGPIILSASRHFVKHGYNNAKIIIDLKPSLSIEELDKRILRDFLKYANKDYINALSDLLPNKIIPVVCNVSSVEDRKKVRDITKAERRSLLETMKSFTVNISGSSGFSEAIITCGGVNIKEINPKTMESRLLKGLYFCGEILDVDAYTGGYNLQIAFSTGYLAGLNA